MIKQFTRVYVRTYSDNGQVTAYVEWVDHAGNKGRTEGSALRSGNFRRPKTATFGEHMHALVRAAKRQGISLQRETWW